MSACHHCTSAVAPSPLPAPPLSLLPHRNRFPRLRYLHLRYSHRHRCLQLYHRASTVTPPLLASTLGNPLCSETIPMDTDHTHTSSTDDPQIPSSPYYIHSSESPSSVSVTPPLARNNYHFWSRSFKMALISKNKMGFITGSIHVPDTQCLLYPSWERCNNLIISWLLNSVSQSIAQSVFWFCH